MVNYCKYCGGKLPADEESPLLVCPFCGRSYLMSPYALLAKIKRGKICPSCGCMNLSDARFCVQCGTRVKSPNLKYCFSALKEKFLV